MDNVTFYWCFVLLHDFKKLFYIVFGTFRQGLKLWFSCVWYVTLLHTPLKLCIMCNGSATALSPTQAMGHLMR